jgi:GntR family transcriptional regulator/MocR family aminotransferase
VLTPPARFELVPRGADPALFPRRAWAAAVRDALQAAPDRALGDLEPAGAPALRRALAEHLGRSRGAVVGADRVVVCQGATQAVAVALAVVAAAGVRTVGLEDPCRPEVRAAAARAGLVVVPVPVGPDGLALERLTGVAAVVVAPAHQHPTGSVLSAAHRERLLASELLIIEDDRGAAHRYDGPPPAVLQGAAPERVLLVGSVSDALAAGLRLGWVVVPRHLVASATALRGALDGGSPVIDQLALAALLDSAAYDRHLRVVRAEYRRRREALLEALADQLPDVIVHGDRAGLHLAIDLSMPIDRVTLTERLAREQVDVGLLEDDLAVPRRSVRTLVVSYARLAPVAALPAARALRRAIDPVADARPSRGRARREPPVVTGARPAAAPGTESAAIGVLALDVRGVEDADVAAIVAAIRASGADLVGLQNAAGGTERLARALGWAHWDAAHHVVSRFPLLRPAGRLHLLVEVAPDRFCAHANTYLSSHLYGPAQVIAGVSPGRVAAIERRVRLPELAPVLGELRGLVASGVPIVMTGGFNTPLDPGWPVPDAIAEAGFIDAFGDRPGATWPVPGFPVDPLDGSDRIDGVVVGGPVEVLRALLVGEPGGPDVELEVDPWRGDHRAVAARLRVVPAIVAPFAAPQRAIVAIGEPLRVALAGADEASGRVILVSADGDAGRPLRRRAVADVGVDGTLALPTAGLRPGAYDVIRQDDRRRERSRSRVWLSAGAAPAISAGRRRYRVAEPLALSWRDGPGNRWDWVGVYPEGADPTREEPMMFRFCGAQPSGALVLEERLPPGRYLATLMLDDGYDVLAVTAFEVRQPTVD